MSKLSPDLIARLRSHADSWERGGAIPFDALVSRNAEAEASILREAADALALIADWAKEDTVGHVIVNWVGNRVFGGDPAFADGFLDFYDPAKWLGSHRAAAAYIAMKWEEDRERLRTNAKEQSA